MLIAFYDDINYGYVSFSFTLYGPRKCNGKVGSH